MTSYHDNLPKKRMAAGVLFFDGDGKILIVKTTYKDHWEIPGGVVEMNESPREACKREILEELTLHVEPTSLLCLDYGAATKEKSESLQFVFDGGQLSQNQIDAIQLDNKELSEYRFVDAKKAAKLLSGSLGARVLKSIAVKNNGEDPYIEH